MGRVHAGAYVASLQAGLPEVHRGAFEAELGNWFPALKWLIKEFRLHIGYETPDEEACMRFWIDRFQRPSSGARSLSSSVDADSLCWPTADEPMIPGTPLEVQQARGLPQEAVEQHAFQFFDLRRRLCPDTPILVPMQQLDHFQAPWDLKAQHWRAARHHRAAKRPRSVVLPSEPGRGRAERAPEKRSGSLPKAVEMSQEVQDRLFPKSVAGGGQPFMWRRQPVSGDHFTSRVIDLAIEFDGDAQRASRLGLKLILDGRIRGDDSDSEAAPAAGPRRWHEGRSPLQALRLAQFWLQLGNKSALGLLIPAAKADRLLEARGRGEGFADAVRRLFVARFGYDCIDAGVLYRFWLATPKAVRSAHHLRGLPNAQALGVLRETAEAWAESRKSGEAAPAGAIGPGKGAGGRPAWKPPGEALQMATPKLDAALLTAATAAVLPQGLPRATPKDVLARPSAKSDTLQYLKALAARFKHDPVLKRMLRQSLDGARCGLRCDFDAYDEHQDEVILKNALPRASDVPLGAAEVMKPRKNTSFQVWLAEGTDRAGLILQRLKSAQEKTKKIKGFLRMQVKQYLNSGARLGPLGLYGGERSDEDSQQLHGLLLVDDVFARLCRREGTAEVLARFSGLGADYLVASDCVAPGGLLAPRFPVVLGRGGASVDCGLRQASCKASSGDADRAVDGDPSTGWRPDPAAPLPMPGTTFPTPTTWWLANLGRLQSCTGVILEWVQPRRHEVQYANKFQMLADLHLEGGRGAPIVATFVRPGGVAARAGVARGDVLQLGVGGDGDKQFREMPPMEALDAIQAAMPKLVFEGPQHTGAAASLPAPSSTRPAQEQIIKVKLFASKREVEPRGPRDLEAVVDEQELKVVAGRPCPLPGVFVGRWVRLDFAGAWPQLGQQKLLLSVRIMKVWRLAPPQFRYAFLDLVRQHAKRSVGIKEFDAVERAFVQSRPKGLRHTFWSSSAKPTTFNHKVMLDLERRVTKDHDFEGDDEEALLAACDRNLSEFNTLRPAEAKALRRRIFARLEDVRECTFHPRSGSNVAQHIYRIRERISEKPETHPGIKGFVESLGENFETEAYRCVYRRSEFNRARRDFVRGELAAAQKRLERKFNVKQILERFRCFHKGCGKILDQTAEVCGCGGFFCKTHKLQSLHNCKAKKNELIERAKRLKDEHKRMRDEGEVPPPDEKFDNKTELGLILEVYALAREIMAWKQVKEKQRFSLQRLGQSLSQFGAIRLLERPFRNEMCFSALTKKRSWTSKGGSKVPVLGSTAETHHCGCDKAHHPSELRFKAAESVARRAEWIKEAIEECKARADVIPCSGAEHLKFRKSRSKSQPKGRRRYSARMTALRRARSEPHALRQLSRVMDERAQNAQWAKDLLERARDRVEDGELVGALSGMEQAKALATTTALAPALAGGRGAAAPAASPQSPDAAHRRELLARIRAVAGQGGDASPTMGAARGRSLRDCEARRLQQRGDEVARQSHELLQGCEDLAAEVARREQERRRSGADRFGSPQPLSERPAPSTPFEIWLQRAGQQHAERQSVERPAVSPAPPGATFSGWPGSGGPPAAAIGGLPPSFGSGRGVPPLPVPLLPLARRSAEQAGETHDEEESSVRQVNFGSLSGEFAPRVADADAAPQDSSFAVGQRRKQQMCADFLDAGHCEKGDACPMAHYPSELASRGAN